LNQELLLLLNYIPDVANPNFCTLFLNKFVKNLNQHGKPSFFEFIENPTQFIRDTFVEYFEQAHKETIKSACNPDLN
jgi:hypothetical protein